MARNKNLKDPVSMSLKIKRSVYVAFKGLAQEHDISIKFLLRRLIEDAIITRRIPWPGSHPANPDSVHTYDGAEETQTAKQTDGQKHPVPPAG
jgi:hypothetical protein